MPFRTYVLLLYEASLCRTAVLRLQQFYEIIYEKHCVNHTTQSYDSSNAVLDCRRTGRRQNADVRVLKYSPRACRISIECVIREKYRSKAIPPFAKLSEKERFGTSSGDLLLLCL